MTLSLSAVATAISFVFWAFRKLFKSHIQFIIVIRQAQSNLDNIGFNQHITTKKASRKW